MHFGPAIGGGSGEWAKQIKRGRLLFRLLLFSSMAQAIKRGRTAGAGRKSFFLFFSCCRSSSKLACLLPQSSHPIPTVRFYGSSLRLCLLLMRFGCLPLTDSTPKHRSSKNEKKRKRQGAARRRPLLGHPFSRKEKRKKALENGSRHVGQHGLFFGPQGLRRGREMRQQIPRAVR